MIKYFSKGSIANFSEALIFKIVIIDNKLIIFAGNIGLLENVIVNKLEIPYGMSISHCVIVYDFKTLTFDYDESRNIPLEFRECIGGENIISGNYFEIWLNSNKETIFFDDNFELREFTKAFSKDEIRKFFKKDFDYKIFI